MRQKYLIYAQRPHFRYLAQSMVGYLPKNVHQWFNWFHYLTKTLPHLIYALYCRFIALRYGIKPSIRSLLKYHQLSCYAGLSHNHAALAAPLLESLLLGRTAVILPPFLLLEHNHKVPVFMRWSDMYNIDALMIFEGHKPKVIESDAYLAKCNNETSVLHVSIDHKISAAENEKYDVIARDTTGFYGFFGEMKQALVNVQKAPISIAKPVRLFHLNTANQAHANKIISELGDYYSLACRARYPKEGIEEQRYRTYQKCLVVKDLAHMLTRQIPVGSRLYIASNIWDDVHYFDALKAHYHLFCYRDFKTLRKIAEQPNTFHALAIEQAIHKKAIKHIYIHPYKGEVEKLVAGEKI